MLLIVFLLSLLLVAVFYLYSTWTYDYWKKKGVPYAKPLPLFGNILDVMILKKALPDVIMELYRASGGLPFLGYYQLRAPALLIRDPEIVKQVLVTNFDSFCVRMHPVDRRLDPLLARNPMSLQGNVWKAVRTLLSPAFTSTRIKSLFPLMAYECREMVQYLENEASNCRPDGLQVKDVTCKFFTDVVMRCGFGVFGNSFNESEAILRKFGEEFTTFGKWKTGRILLAFFARSIPTFLRARFMDLNGQNFFRLLITELIQYRERNRVFRNDYLQMLMHIKNMGNTVKGKNTIRVAGVTIEYTDEDIASNALTFFLVGCELPSSVLTSALYELALNPEIQIQLRAEIDSVLRRHCGGLTYDAVLEMSFLDMVLKETMRKYPACPVLFRLCTKSCQLPLPDGGTFILEKGTAITIPVEGFQMDYKYFPEPENFEPERFSNEREDSIQHFTFLPYGDGPRQCFGIEFGEAMMKAGLVAIVSHFEIRTTPKTPMKIVKDPCTFMLSAKGGMWLDFVRRQ